MTQNHYPSKRMIDRARGLRKASLSPEQLLWTALRNEQIGGLKFRRQHPIGPYVVDFYCHAAGLVVEVDGFSHDEKVLQDAERTKCLEGRGLRVLRVTNDDVMGNLDGVTRELLVWAAWRGIETPGPLSLRERARVRAGSAQKPFALRVGIGGEGCEARAIGGRHVFTDVYVRVSGT